MGKGIIKSGGADGFYNVELTFERDRIGKTIAAIDAHVESLTSIIDTMDEGTEKELLKLKRNSYIKKKEYIQNHMPEDPTVSAWCADLTEDITGNVGTIEIPGERGIVQIQPGYEGSSIYDAIRDGQLQPSIASTPAATFYNLAMLPGWQKWKPTYRYGVISNIDIDTNTCDVKLDSAESSQQGLDINQELNLIGISVSYMSCDSVAFEDGDNVLVKFEGQTWAGAQVVGFKDNPKDCEFYIDIIINDKVPEYTKSLKIVDNNDDEYIASSSTEEPGKVGPFQGVVFPAKIYLYYTGGAGKIFSYFKTPGTTGYLVAKIGHGSYCKEEWGRSNLIGHFYPDSYTPTGDEEFILSAEKVEYLLHGIFNSKPTEPIAFTTKLLGKLQVKSSEFNFTGSGCGYCQPVSTTKTWAADMDSVVYPSWIGAFSDFPSDCRVHEIGPYYCSSYRVCMASSQWDSFNECDISNIAIMTDENGHNPVFTDASVSVGFFAWEVSCVEVDEYGDWLSDICYALEVELLDAQNYAFKMLPTPEDII